MKQDRINHLLAELGKQSGTARAFLVRELERLEAEMPPGQLERFKQLNPDTEWQPAGFPGGTAGPRP